MKCGSSLFIAFLCYAASSSFALTGSGVPGDPYIIGSIADLNTVTSDSGYWDDSLRLDSDLDLTGQTYSTALLGHDFATAFTGSFDGNGHVISNIMIDTDGAAQDYLGFFGYLDTGAAVFNLGVENMTIITGDNSNYIGGLIGFNYSGSSGLISQCYVTGTITTGNDCQYVGGFNGYTLSQEIKDCYCQCDIVCGDNSQDVGGFMGYSSNAKLTRNYSASQISVGTGSTGVDAFLGSNNMLIQTANFSDVTLAGRGTFLAFVGKTTLEMYQKATYQEAAWDFSSKWKMPTRNYPLCGWQAYTIGIAELQRLAANWITTSNDPSIVYPIDYYTDDRIDYKDFAQLSLSMGADTMFFSAPEIFDGFETGDFSALNWSTTGLVPWQVVTDNPYQGTYSASSGPLVAGKNGVLTLIVTSGENKVEFYFSKSHTNSLYFLIDGGVVGIWSTAITDQRAEFDLTEGEHTLQWIYLYPLSGSTEGRVWLDNVRIY